MADATKATIDPREAEHFGRLAADWWNPKGSSAMLHRLNPARLRYVREARLPLGERWKDSLPDSRVGVGSRGRLMLLRSRAAEVSECFTSGAPPRPGEGFRVDGDVVSRGPTVGPRMDGGVVGRPRTTASASVRSRFI